MLVFCRGRAGVLGQRRQIQELPRDGHELLTSWAQPESSSDTVEQSRAELCLKLSDLLRDGRCCVTECGRRRGDRPAFRYVQECP